MASKEIKCPWSWYKPSLYRHDLTTTLWTGMSWLDYELSKDELGELRVDVHLSEYTTLRRNCRFRIYSISWLSLSTTYKNDFLWPNICKKSFLNRKFCSANLSKECCESVWNIQIGCFSKLEWLDSTQMLPSWKCQCGQSACLEWVNWCGYSHTMTYPVFMLIPKMFQDIFPILRLSTITIHRWFNI